MASANSLVVNLTAKTSAFERGIARARRRIAAFATYAKRTLTGIGRTLMNPATVLGGFAAGAGVGGMIKLAADVETLNVQFKVLTGSADDAARVMADVQKFAAETPFQQMDIADAARMLISFGAGANTVVDELRMLGDLAAGTGQPLGQLAEIYGKARVQGRLFGEDINQLTGRGIPVIQALAQQFGVAESQVKKLVEQGRVGFPELQAALQSMTGPGGKFNGLMKELSTTTAGKFSTLIDNLKQVGIIIGEAILPAANIVIDALLSWGDGIRTFGKVAGVVLGNLGQTFAVAFETAKGYASAAFSFIIDSAAVMVQNVAISISNVFAELKAYLQNIGEQAAVALGLADQALNVQAAPGRALLQMPEFKAPELGPIAKDFAVKIEKAITPPEMPALDMQSIDEALSIGDVRRGESQAMQTKATGALQRGSAEAYSAIVQAMMGSGDPTVSAIQKMQKAIVDQLKKNAPKAQQVELVGDLKT
jgi:tape measure domain-containing protein